LTVAEAIVISAALYVVSSIALSMFGWFVAFPWQERWKYRQSAWSAFPRIPLGDEDTTAKEKPTNG